MAETTLWPIVLRQSLKLKDIDVYLTASRGSIVAAVEALLNIRGSRHLVVLFIVLAVAVLLQVNAIIVGYSFEESTCRQCTSVTTLPVEEWASLSRNISLRAPILERSVALALSMSFRFRLQLGGHA